MLIYWIAIFIADFIKFSFLIIMLYPFLVYRYFDLIYSLPIIILFIISACLLNYILSHLFDTETSGQKFSLLIIYIFFIILIILDVFKNALFDDKETINRKDENEHLNKFYFSDLFPSSELGLILLMLIK